MTANTRKIKEATTAANSRKTKLSRGMTYTTTLQGNRTCAKSLSDTHASAVINLIVSGTTDKLIGLAYKKRHKICQCCGAKTGKLELNDAGKRRLFYLRRKRAENEKNN